MSAPIAELALRVQLASFAGPELTTAWAALLADGLGGVCLFGSNLAGDTTDPAAAAQLAGLADAVHGARGDALVAIDEEGGDVTRLHARQASPVPGPAVLGAVDDLELTAAAGHAVGAELAALGIDLCLGPVADINSNPANPVIGTRSFGAEPALVGRHVTAWGEGLRSAGVGACAKHFPGHGDTADDSHVGLPVLGAGRRQIEERELTPFAAAVRAGVPAVMTSHVLVPALDPDHPATMSRTVLDLLRTDLGFEGVIVSDALDMAGASAGRGIAEAAVLALAAGADLLCIGPDKDAALIRAIQAAIVAATEEGRLDAKALARSAERVARLPRVGHPRSRARGDDAPSSARFVDAARAALVVEGALPDRATLAALPVLSVDSEPNVAVGAARWGLRPDAVLPVGSPVPTSPAIVQVRDAHRRPEVVAMLAGLPEGSVVVEWGWPGPRAGWSGRDHARVCTRGNSLASIAAVADLLGRGERR